MAPSSGHEDRSERRETGPEGDEWCDAQEEAVRELAAEYGKSLGLREVESAKRTEINLTEKTRARRNTRSIPTGSVGRYAGRKKPGRAYTVSRKDSENPDRGQEKPKRTLGKKEKRNGGPLRIPVGDKDRWVRLEESRLWFKNHIENMKRIAKETREKVTKTKTIEARRRMKEKKRRKEETRKRYKARRAPMAPSLGCIKDRWEKLEESRIRFKNQMEEIKRIRDERQVLIQILSTEVSKEEIREIIRESLARGGTRERKKIRLKDKDYEKNESKQRLSKQRRARKRKQGKRQKLGRGGRGVGSEEGRVGPQLTEVAKVITGGWEQRRREMLERWEAPPPGPPGSLI